jgi:hypothetical protein
MKSLISIFLIVFVVFSAAAQSTRLPKKEIFEVQTVPRGGWATPVFGNDVSPSPKEARGLIEYVVVDIKTNYFNKEKVIYFENCDVEADAKIPEDQRILSVVAHFRTYETKGRIFAYELTGKDQKTWKEFFKLEDLSDQNKDASVGLVSLVFKRFLYVDEYGDGSFQRRCGAWDLKDLPQWVKDLGEIRVKTSKQNL